MGSPDTEQGRSTGEGPQHEVTISEPFYISRFEITQAQWEAAMGSNPATGSGIGNDHPVNNVSWNDCQQYVRVLSTTGLGTFRLPTEAEWEYACRAGTTTRFYWGDDPANQLIHDYTWNSINSGNQTHGVALKQPNPWGLYDMSGNVWEWCQDWNGAYPDGPEVDPQGPGVGSFRANRGGSWLNNAIFLRSASRGNDQPGARAPAIGLRIVREFP